MTSVEVQSPPPPSPDTTAEGESQEAATSSPVEGEGAPASTYEWLASVPVLSSAGSTVYGWYEGSKNYTRASKYALDSVETSVKYVAGTAASVVKGPSKFPVFLMYTQVVVVLKPFSVVFPCTFST